MKQLQKQLLLLIITILLLTSCSSDEQTSPTPEPSQTPEPIWSMNYCNITPQNLCLEGYGQESEDNLLILLKADNPDFRNIYLHVNENKENAKFTCTASDLFPENIYCIGENFPNGVTIELKVYAADTHKIISIGDFTIQSGNMQLPNDIINEDYPNYPNYPNDSN